MPIVIVLLATIVAFLLGGPFIAIATLLIGLVVVFPNQIGVIAAVIGVIILLTKFDISISMLILIIFGIFGILILVSFMSDDSLSMHYDSLSPEERKKYINERSEKQKILNRLGVNYTLIEDSEKVQKCIVEPNTDEVWSVLKDALIIDGKIRNFDIVKIEQNLVVLKLEPKKGHMQLKNSSENGHVQMYRNQDELILTVENIKNLSIFTREKKDKEHAVSEQSTVEKKDKQIDTAEKTSNNIDDLMKLSNLLKEGLITEDEYQSEKSKLLNSK